MAEEEENIYTVRFTRIWTIEIRGSDRDDVEEAAGDIADDDLDRYKPDDTTFEIVKVEPA